MTNPVRHRIQRRLVQDGISLISEGQAKPNEICEAIERAGQFTPSEIRQARVQFERARDRRIKERGF